jgi:hypothetical protein
MSWVEVRMKRDRRQMEAVKEITKLGGEVEYDYEALQSPDPFAPKAPPGPEWLRKLFGQDFFATVVVANFGSSSVTDAGLEHLKGMTQLQGLDIHDTQVSDVGLEHVKRLTQLQELSIYNTKVTDEGVKRLQQALPKCKIY